MPLEIKVIFPFAPLGLPSGIHCSTSRLHMASVREKVLTAVVERDFEWKPPVLETDGF